MVNTLPVPVRAATAATGTAHNSRPISRMRSVRRRLGRSWCRASSGISGAGPPSPESWAVGLMTPGARRAINHPAAPATTITTGNGTWNRASAAKEATASPTRRGRVRERRPTRHTAWATMATTAGASPANSPVTAVVVPRPTYSADRASNATTPGSTKRVPAARPPRVPLSSQPV
ncbi:hypothetical protein QF035_010287 [Streptomyces umbrinus]|uniref:Uncharacterized protein n=1 Tax=Streptomyces umbrinus TaxID=67370 RepID=A0ABU0TA66_9ACTN|nr:hypothetical protein [Streptomyces umbrinus]MDQ1032705.1 hypothetical protein [Streptomyces umbrinus]